jgi:excisionase family DNA binding protein
MTTKHDMVAVKEAADLLRVNVKTVYALIAAGKLGSVRVGRAIRIPRIALSQLGCGTAC